MIKRLSHGCFHISVMSRPRSTTALGTVIDARAWYTGRYENSLVITCKYMTYLNIVQKGGRWHDCVAQLSRQSCLVLSCPRLSFIGFGCWLVSEAFYCLNQQHWALFEFESNFRVLYAWTLILPLTGSQKLHDILYTCLVCLRFCGNCCCMLLLLYSTASLITVKFGVSLRQWILKCSIIWVHWMFAASGSRPLDWKEYVLRENATVAPVTCFKHVCIYCI